MVKGYTIHYQSDAYNSSLDDVILDENWESAVRRLLKNNKEEDSALGFEYYIFDVTEIKLHLHNNCVEFVISCPKINKCFKQFCLEKFKKVKNKWTYLEFKDHIGDLKVFFVYEKDIGDDPFCSYYLEFLELEVNPNQTQKLEIIRNQDDCKDISYRVISPEQAHESEFECNGIWYFSDTHKIKIAE
jgi:hypothetical protein